MIPECDVVLSPGEDLPEAECWLVIDILRATTTMCAFFEAGGKRLYPAESVEEGLALRERMSGEGEKPLLMGERNALPPPGFDLGNSPLDLSPDLLASRPTAVMATTNGTRALLKAAAAGTRVYPVCARNAEATVRAAVETGGRIGILCAGLHGRAALDDTACAGVLVEQLVARGTTDLKDGARMALSVWREGERNLAVLLKRSVHGTRLLSLGFSADLAFAAEIDSSEVVIRLRQDRGIPFLAREPE
jgi:2-phosphosulfolactate phosphatase